MKLKLVLQTKEYARRELESELFSFDSEQDAAEHLLHNSVFYAATALKEKPGDEFVKMWVESPDGKVLCSTENLDVKIDKHGRVKLKR